MFLSFIYPKYENILQRKKYVLKNFLICGPFLVIQRLRISMPDEFDPWCEKIPHAME